ncbi:MAG: RHS repeat-associated core domain-containing protein, partial [Planctomycetes bacterium]|nr:RHS repeat-associated core domain-containing protein [Planctomycetota bacterium]
VAADPADTTRYGYAGSYGYESGLLTLACPDPSLPPITLQHVGARWYEPAIGRFVQRDPIGIGGGINVYAYVDGNPVARVDPPGLAAQDPDYLAIVDKAAAAAAGAVGAGMAAGAVGGPVGSVTGGVALGLGAAAGVGVYESGKYTCVSLWDIGGNLLKARKAKADQLRQRRENPEVFPPHPPVINAPDPPPD